VPCSHGDLVPQAVSGDFYAYFCRDCQQFGRVSGKEIFGAMKSQNRLPELEDLVRRSFPVTRTVEEE
jgi:hypothetical protein